MKTIEINKGGFGVASLFSDESNKEILVQQSDMSGKYLDELGITYKVGDSMLLKEPLSGSVKGHKVYGLRVHAVTDDKYECEFIDKQDAAMGMIQNILK